MKYDYDREQLGSMKVELIFDDTANFWPSTAELIFLLLLLKLVKSSPMPHIKSISSFNHCPCWVTTALEALLRCQNSRYYDFTMRHKHQIKSQVQGRKRMSLWSDAFCLRDLLSIDPCCEMRNKAQINFFSFLSSLNIESKALMNIKEIEIAIWFPNDWFYFLLSRCHLEPMKK